MIRYALKCANGHAFESWFRSAEAFDGLLASGLISCPHCGEAKVQKSLMAPNVTTGRQKEAAMQAQLADAGPGGEGRRMHALTAPASAAEAALNELKRKIEANSEYVGNRFAEEARAIHVGDAPTRSIYGETTGEEAERLIEDGVPVAPLPFMPVRKTN